MKALILDKKFTEEELNRMRELMQEPGKVVALDSFSQVEFLQDELQAASDYIAENEVIHKKVKKDVPTVIEYRGRRYVLDHADHRK